MLIDHRKTALNDANVLCRETSDRCLAAARAVDDPAVKETLESLGRERARWADELESHIRRIGYPKEPDPEKEALEQWLSRVKAAFASDGRLAWLKDIGRGEQELARAVIAAQQEVLPEDARRFLARLMAALVEAQEVLASLKSGMES